MASLIPKHHHPGSQPRVHSRRNIYEEQRELYLLVAYLERRRGERFARRRRHVVLQGVGEVVGVGVEEVLRQIDELKQAQILCLRCFPVPVSVKNSKRRRHKRTHLKTKDPRQN